jgi:hypothetical protein
MGHASRAIRREREIWEAVRDSWAGRCRSRAWAERRAHTLRHREQRTRWRELRSRRGKPGKWRRNIRYDHCPYRPSRARRGGAHTPPARAKQHAPPRLASAQRAKLSDGRAPQRGYRHPSPWLRSAQAQSRLQSTVPARSCRRCASGSRSATPPLYDRAFCQHQDGPSGMVAPSSPSTTASRPSSASVCLANTCSHSVRAADLAQPNPLIRSTTMTSTVGFDPKDLESKFKAMYRDVAENPPGEFHFENGARDGRAPGLRAPGSGSHPRCCHRVLRRRRLLL